MATTPPPVPTQSQITDKTGLVTRPWIYWFQQLRNAAFGFNEVIQSAGVALPQENAINFIAPIVVTDNPKNGSTDVSLPPAAYTLKKGTVTVNPTGGDYASADVEFATEFGEVPNVQATPQGFPRGGNEPMSCIVSGKTASGFTVNLACSVPTGGGGATINQGVDVDWVAIG